MNIIANSCRCTVLNLAKGLITLMSSSTNISHYHYELLMMVIDASCSAENDTLISRPDTEIGQCRRLTKGSLGLIYIDWIGQKAEPMLRPLTNHLNTDYFIVSTYINHGRKKK